VKYVDQGTFDPKLKGILAPEGFKLEVVADAPTVINPVGLTFTPDGTLLVLEWKPDPGREWYEFKETFRYRDGTTKAVATMKKFLPDPVKVLFRNSKGIYDRAEVIFTDELPSTLLYHDGWLYTASRGTVRRYRQTQPGGKWDLRETIAQGFCGFHHHQVSGLTMGPDGWLYITSGDDDNFVEGSDGSRATVLRTGAIFRCKPDGSKMETFSLGYRNPYRDLAFDNKYNWFHADNDNEDGSRFTGCRLVHVAEDVDYGWRLLEGARCCRPDHIRGAVAGERPGKLQPMLKTGRGSPAGVLLYHDTQLPEQYRGLMYYPDVFRKSVRAYKLAPTGSTFAITHEFEFLKSDDPLFRPCQMVIGPDGAIYICDWRTDSGGAGKLWGDSVHGCIYRLSWAGTKDQPEIPLRPMNTWTLAGPRAPIDAVTGAYHSADLTTRQHGLQEMIRRSAADADSIRKYFLTDFTADAENGRGKRFSTEVRLLCLYGLQQLWNEDASRVFIDALKDPDPNIRRVAAEGLGRNSLASAFAVNELLIKALTDESRAVRRSAALALGRIGADSASDAILNAWKADDGQDAFLTDAYLRALEKLGSRGIKALLAVAQSGDDAILKKVAQAYTTLRTRPAFDALPELLAHPHLNPDLKTDLVRSYLNYQFDPPLSMEPLAQFLTSRPNEPVAVRITGLEVLAATGGVGGGKGAEFVLGLVDAKEEPVRLAAFRAIENGRILTAASKLRVALADAKRSVPEREAVLRAGRVVGGPEFIAVVKELLGSEKEPALLKVEALRTLSARDASAASAFAQKFLDQPDPALIAESISVLGASKDGAKLVGQRYLEKKLPRDLFPRVSDALRKFIHDEAIAQLNTEVLRGGLLLSLEPDQVEKIRTRVQTHGDPKKGKAVYLNSATLACTTCHKLEGVGGNVGPDLTRVWDTMTTEKLLESMVAPSKEIKEGYQSYRATTLGGQSYVGLKVTDTPQEVTIREATGRDVKIPRKDLDSLDASKQSLMPDNVVSQLSYDQFIDLLAFLKNRKEQESLRGIVVAAQWWRDHSLGAGNGTTVGGDITADASGVFVISNLAEGTSTLRFTAAVYSPKNQSAAVTLRADDMVQMTIENAKVFDRTTTRPAAFAQEEKFTVELREGWNNVTVQMATNGKQHRLALQFAGEGLRTAAKPEK
jgi:putative membrane-bound dehydrogenase-like protein